jgi:hypothetical protein
MVPTLHVAYTADHPLDRALPGEVLPHGHEALAGRAPLDVIREISQSGKLRGRLVRSAWVLQDHPHRAAAYTVAAVLGLVPMAIEEQCTPETKRYTSLRQG